MISDVFPGLDLYCTDPAQTSHNGRWGARWSRWWPIWYICPRCVNWFDVNVGWSWSPPPRKAHSMKKVKKMARVLLTACGCIQETILTATRSRNICSVQLRRAPLPRRRTTALVRFVYCNIISLLFWCSKTTYQQCQQCQREQKRSTYLVFHISDRPAGSVVSRAKKGATRKMRCNRLFCFLMAINRRWKIISLIAIIRDTWAISGAQDSQPS